MKNQSLNNPAVAAAASNPDLIKEGKDIIINTQQRAISTAKVALTLVATAVTGYVAWGKYKKWQKQRYINKNANIPDVQAAMIMRKAMKRLEMDTWLFGMVSIPDGTNESLLNELALKVTSLQKVTEAYNILFESNLALDVYNELTDNELVKFYENLGGKGEYNGQFNSNGTVKPQTPFKVGQKLQAKNPNGVVIYEAIENANGSFKGSSNVRSNADFSDKIGQIKAIYKGTSGQHYYVVDLDDFSYGPDWIYGYGWVAHTEVKLQ